MTGATHCQILRIHCMGYGSVWMKGNFMNKYGDPPFEVCKECQFFEYECWCAPGWEPEWCPAKRK